jgi:RAD50-interacting protein 1
MLAETRARLHTAQELSLSRHSLLDDLASLRGDLTSSLSNPDRQPTLLEELETLQRQLAELNHVRDYIRVVHHALGL